MEVTLIKKTKEGRIKVYTKEGPSYTFWHDGEFKEFAARNLKFKPDDVPLQDVVREVIRICPSLSSESLAEVKGTCEQLKLASEVKDG